MSQKIRFCPTCGMPLRAMVCGLRVCAYHGIVWRQQTLQESELPSDQLTVEDFGTDLEL